MNFLNNMKLKQKFVFLGILVVIGTLCILFF